MRIVGVLDLLDDRAVHARGGRRALYEPVVMVAGEPIQPGHAPDLARAYVDRLGLDEVYVADLTAIAASLERSRRHGRARTEPPRHQGTLDGIIACGATVWLDAGIATPDDARHAMHLGATRVVVGLETLPSWKALEEICHLLGPGHVTFSLDLRDAAPVSSLGLVSGRTRPETVVDLAAEAGVAAVIVLELARVGTGSGPDFETIESVRRAVPTIGLYAGGGVRGPQDLWRLADAGCDGALVATALHDGRLGSGDVAAARRRSLDRVVAHLSAAKPHEPDGSAREFARDLRRLPDQSDAFDEQDVVALTEALDGLSSSIDALNEEMREYRNVLSEHQQWVSGFTKTIR